METKLPHERLDVCRVYLETANQCGDVVANAEQQIVAFDHLERASEAQVREERASYGNPGFPFTNLDMYRVSLQGVAWIHDFLEEINPKTRVQRRLDTSSTGTVLNIAEGHGRETAADQNRFMKTAQEHAYQTLVLLDVMAARKDVTASRVAEGKATQTRVIRMLHAWCESNNTDDPSE